MQSLARLAIGTIQPGVDGSFVAWALMAALERAGLRVQHFAARACFSPQDGAAGITGQATRHLDSWLMEPEAVRALLDWGSSASDFALVEGGYRPALSPVELRGGDLQTLCDWLALPRVAIIDAASLADCQLPECPRDIDGILIDNAAACGQRCRLQTSIEALWGIPVLGFAASAATLRAQLAVLPAGAAPPQELVAALGEQVFSPSTIERVVQLARKGGGLPRLAGQARAERSNRAMRVAIAFDEAFHCYFPDTLDQLERQGAELVDFSPLRDDRLPAGIDLVYFGCGRPELHARTLTGNCCMIAALHNFVGSGGRLYAECGGLAYLARSIDLPEGDRVRMSGVLPITASIDPTPQPPIAVEINLAADSWLGNEGLLVRGYRTSRWRFEPIDGSVQELSSQELSSDVADEHDILQWHNAIGSRVHLNFAAQPPLMARLFEPLVGESAVLSR